MLVRAAATVARILTDRKDVQEIETEFGVAFNYIELTGLVSCGDRVLINRTASHYDLGTGGSDFVMARLDDNAPASDADPVRDGHIVKLRYTPVQHTVRTLEEDESNAYIWDHDLAGFPVVVGQLHSQIAPVAAALATRGLRCAYVMTDGAALPITLSRLVIALKESGLIAHTITAGQAFGGEYETVTVHSALLAAAHLLSCDVAIVCQGPGNAGTGTKYGFSGIEQANVLDTVAALGGIPVAVVRASSGDKRKRHKGISHHTFTALTLVRSHCVVGLPPGLDPERIASEHDVRVMDGTEGVLDKLKQFGIDVTTLGRRVDEDRLFFEAAAAAGLIAANMSRHGGHMEDDIQ